MDQCHYDMLAADRTAVHLSGFRSGKLQMTHGGKGDAVLLFEQGRCLAWILMARQMLLQLRFDLVKRYMKLGKYLVTISVGVGDGHQNKVFGSNGRRTETAGLLEGRFQYRTEKF